MPDIDNLDFDEFFRYYALAELARELGIEDLREGIGSVLSEMFGKKGG